MIPCEKLIYIEEGSKKSVKSTGWNFDSKDKADIKTGHEDTHVQNASVGIESKETIKQRLFSGYTDFWKSNAFPDINENNINIHNENGCTRLGLAVKLNYLDLVFDLLDMRANPNLISMSCDDVLPLPPLPALNIAIRCRHVDIAMILLNENFCSYQSVSPAKIPSPIVEAYETEQFNIIDKLLEKGESLDSIDPLDPFKAFATYQKIKNLIAFEFEKAKILGKRFLVLIGEEHCLSESFLLKSMIKHILASMNLKDYFLELDEVRLEKFLILQRNTYSVSGDIPRIRVFEDHEERFYPVAICYKQSEKFGLNSILVDLDYEKVEHLNLEDDAELQEQLRVRDKRMVAEIQKKPTDGAWQGGAMHLLGMMNLLPTDYHVLPLNIAGIAHKPKCIQEEFYCDASKVVQLRLPANYLGLSISDCREFFEKVLAMNQLYQNSFELIKAEILGLQHPEADVVRKTTKELLFSWCNSHSRAAKKTEAVKKKFVYGP